MANFNIDKDLIRELAQLLDETGLTEIEVEDDDRRIRIAKGGTATQTIVTAPGAGVAPPGPPPVDGGAADLSLHPGAVKSPMVGTAYLSAEPGKPPFVSVGDKVEAGQTVMIIEAMKTMNPVEAPKGGTVTQILVSNETPVEYGEPLLIIE